MKNKKSVEQLAEKGEIVFLDPVMVKSHGLSARIGLLKAEHEALEIAKAMTEKKSKRVKALINAVMWTVFRCQKNGIMANAVVRVDAAGWPALAMGVYPFNEKSGESVLMIARMKEVAK